MPKKGNLTMGTRGAKLIINTSGSDQRIQKLVVKAQDAADLITKTEEKQKVIKDMQDKTDVVAAKQKMTAKQASQLGRQIATTYLGIMSGMLGGMGEAVLIQRAMLVTQTYQQFLSIKEYGVQATAAALAGRGGAAFGYRALMAAMYGLAMNGLMNTRKTEQLSAEIAQQKATTNYIEVYS